MVMRQDGFRTAGPQPGAITQPGLAEALAGLVADGNRPSDRVRAIRKLGEACWRQHRDVSTLANSGAELLATAASRLPVRDPEALRARYGEDIERVAGQLVAEAAQLARWVWTASAVIPAPARAAHIIKVLVHSAVEIRLVAELYAVYGPGDTPRDPAWLNLVVSAWAADRPVAAGAPVTVGTTGDIVGKLRRAYRSLAEPEARLARLRHRGEGGAEAVRRLGSRFRRRMRSHPSTWVLYPAEPAAVAAVRSVGDMAHVRPGEPPEVASGPPTRYLHRAWSHHLRARAAAASTGPAGDPAVLARLATALAQQEEHLRWLGTKLRQARPPAPGPELARGTDPVRSAHACAGLADDAIDLVEEAGSRPRRLAGWPVRLRNGLVYAAVALALAVLGGLLALVAGDLAVPARVAVLALLAAGLSALAYGFGLLLTGRLFRPWLGGRVARSPGTGLAIAVATTALTLGVLSALG